MGSVPGNRLHPGMEWRLVATESQHSKDPCALICPVVLCTGRGAGNHFWASMGLGVTADGVFWVGGEGLVEAHGGWLEAEQGCREAMGFLG